MQEALGWPVDISVSVDVDNTDERTDLDPQSLFDEPGPEPDNDPTIVRPSLMPALLAARDVQARDTASGGGSGAEARPSFSASLRGKIGKYELRAKIGRGAFGVVFTARDPSLERDVAIKVLRPTHLTNPEIVQRFLQEARATARIAHPGIVMIHDCGRVETTAGVTAFIAMELLAGESVTHRLARSVRFTPPAAVEIVRQVASALEAAHRVDVLHRDLKPDNIYLVPDPAMPEGERVKILDFGLAKLGQDGHTETQIVFGTPRYMSPEQCRSAAQADHRSDIYSLGCILFELITGRSPFDGDVRQLIECHQRQAAPRASSLAPEISPELDALIANMLAKDPMHRPQTMGAVQRALAGALQGVEIAAAPVPAADLLTAIPVGVPIQGGAQLERFSREAQPSRFPRSSSPPPMVEPRPSRLEIPPPPGPAPRTSMPGIIRPYDPSQPYDPSRPPTPFPPPEIIMLAGVPTVIAAVVPIPPQPMSQPAVPPQGVSAALHALAAPESASPRADDLFRTGAAGNMPASRSTRAANECSTALESGPVSGVVLVPAAAGAPALLPAAPTLLSTAPWRKLLLGALCIAIGAAGGAIAWLTMFG